MTTPSDGAEPSPKPAGLFATTHWNVVLAAGDATSPQAAEALEELCRNYWYPLYAFIRRRGHAPEAAQDLTQEFFARLLARHWLGMANRSRGRFRSFLLAALNHFLANEWNRARCAKRGGDRIHLPIDTVAAEQLYRRETFAASTPEALYERNWALQFLDRVRTRMRREYEAVGKAAQFDLAERFLPGEECLLSYAQAAVQLGVPEGTFKSTVHRLKQRYGELLREEIAHTVASPEEIDDELRHLIAVLGR